MNNLDWWRAFQKTGRVADYLRYRGIDVFSGPTPDTNKEGEAHETDDRRPDHSGK